MSDDFCITHGYDYMTSKPGNPIPYCEACEENLEPCPRCGGSGFSGHGTGHDDVCDECGGQKFLKMKQR